MNVTNLQLKLIRKYQLLRDVYIVNYCYDYAILKKRLGKVASNLFERLIDQYKNPKVGIGGGSTIYNMIDTLKYRPRNIRIFPTAIIGRGPEINHIDSSFLATLLYFKSRPLAKAFVINVPPLPSQKLIAREFLNNLINQIDEVKWLVNSMQDVNIAFIGLGAVVPTGDFDNEMNKLGITSRDLIRKGVVGGINYNWFTSEGSQVDNYFITISTENLKILSQNKDNHIVLVAGGTHKVEPIKIVISTGMVNTLITDSLTAEKLIT